MEVRTRFAPSPTGHLHIGGARTALFNYLFAKRYAGKFILRIEDTDLERSSIESEKVIIESLRWLGIEWDEGVEVGGPYGPYRSTERVDIYKKYVDVLFEKGYAYYCYCTEEELEAQRQELLSKGQMPRYLGKCRNLTEEQKRRFEQEGRKPTVRFKVPEGVKIVVHDLVRGDVEFLSDDIGDFVIVKSDGIPTYNFAVVIDDHLMKISHVIRGEEHLSNTPRQILIYNALGFGLPQFAHVSLILGKDRTKMSKRHGSTWVEQYKEQGYLKEGLINFLALLGWSPPEDKEIFDMKYLIENFSLERVSKNPAIFDIDKLNYINSQHIKLKSLDELTQMCIPYFVEAGYIKEDEAKSKFEWLKKIVKSVYEGLDYLSQIKDRVDIFFNNEVKIEEDEAKEVLKWDHVNDLINVFENKIRQMNELTPEAIKLLFKEIQKETGYKGKNLFMPIRVALTGKTHGPELVEIIEIVGKENILKRLEFFKTWYN
ncbi:glutamate--tRNA(Gln) ligase /glutamyl-tRNA synthetase [Caldicellulosiruptor bescii]|uniref:Glutamate--tRNA ligase n=2 Tax=Caldicellulosiruptor bescii TaxID=31899 RepID=B9MMM8_CALBD|nr:glutamate--tRNA ligase [Caldicellulosiruptor bescii]ACM61327.1 glutamyl-tRNA synthetase [Caldicellulosiruptor bescii DSM 6725]PBC88858.1 glutamate--tRNA(Gln) ligase /glutamyl-tRNA synthetase [Caldicellulosiruptor bescii]PBC91660.1 glutamate--tRNA(Gln) ligase /glutamyl-tRNA synthetase [Caldicellulosiruptor bescii]PBD02927.1 glutamate--tRNA(Gln) ligase /glutamyl-tRNA synthetase [Caldicellulosiruptor bescii]PBD07457.1 glutamate--tRNA(Gln) ligase /glutamyl-tRNA synthetase [Caldicellulosiruptor 